jgi:hypothetical protein
MRTKQCRLIARRECLAVVPIVFDFQLGEQITIIIGEGAGRWFVRGDRLEAFARFDGFPDFKTMRGFWKEARGFNGWHIRWLPLPAEITGGNDGS